MTKEQILDVFRTRCEELGTVKRMNIAVLNRLVDTLSKKPDMTEQKVMDACKNPTKMMSLLR